MWPRRLRLRRRAGGEAEGHTPLPAAWKWPAVPEARGSRGCVWSDPASGGPSGSFPLPCDTRSPARGFVVSCLFLPPRPCACRSVRGRSVPSLITGLFKCVPLSWGGQKGDPADVRALAEVAVSWGSGMAVARGKGARTGLSGLGRGRGGARGSSARTS